jgi:aldose 1-epimerase
MSAPRAGGESANLTTWIDFEEGNAVFEGFPFPCRLTLEFTLTRDAVRVAYAVSNRGKRPLPFGFALHPYFAKMDAPEDCFVQVPAPFVHEANDEKFPSGRVYPVEGTYYDLRRPRAISDAVLDHVYQGVRPGDRAWVIWRRSGRAVSLTASPEFDHMVVFTPTERPCICLENQTCSTDAHNRHAAGFEATAHLLVLEPGTTAGGWIEFHAGPWPADGAPAIPEGH